MFDVRNEPRTWDSVGGSISWAPFPELATSFLVVRSLAESLLRGGPFHPWKMSLVLFEPAPSTRTELVFQDLSEPFLRSFAPYSLGSQLVLEASWMKFSSLRKASTCTFFEVRARLGSSSQQNLNSKGELCRDESD